jgi:hypothetical protein
MRPLLPARPPPPRAQVLQSACNSPVAAPAPATLQGGGVNPPLGAPAASPAPGGSTPGPSPSPTPSSPGTASSAGSGGGGNTTIIAAAAGAAGGALLVGLVVAGFIVRRRRAAAAGNNNAKAGAAAPSRPRVYPPGDGDAPLDHNTRTSPISPPDRAAASTLGPLPGMREALPLLPDLGADEAGGSSPPASSGRLLKSASWADRAAPRAQGSARPSASGQVPTATPASTSGLAPPQPQRPSTSGTAPPQRPSEAGSDASGPRAWLQRKLGSTVSRGKVRPFLRF